MEETKRCDERITIMVSKDDKQTIEKYAEDQRLSVSSTIRKLVIDTINKEGRE
jgi:hypothetical protein